MNAERLLAHFGRIADAPDAVARLRQFILDLAVRGRLVPQDPKDEPAAELLKRVASEKLKLVEKRRGKTTDRVPSGVPIRVMFPVPTGWIWTTLGAVSRVVMGQSPPGDTYNTTGEGVPLINGPVEFSPGPFGKSVVNQYTTAPTNFCEQGDLLICVRGSTTGRTNIAGFRACIGRGVAAIQPCFENAFLRLCIWSARESILDMGRGIAFPSVTRKQIEDLRIPLPSLAEQLRIVAKVDDLMALCDQLEAARAEREAVRDRLAAASRARLNAPGPDAFHDDARFALDVLPAITKRPDQIKQLRQSILSLAVRGKLEPQDPRDEPASELLKRVVAEKAQLVKAGEIRGQDAQPLVTDGELGFAIPSGWAPTRIGNLLTVIRGASPRPKGDPKYFSTERTPYHWIKISDIRKHSKERVLLDTDEFLTEAGMEKSVLLPKGTLVVTNSATIGVPIFLGFDGGCIHDGYLAFPHFPGDLSLEFFFVLFQTLQDYAAKMARGMAQLNLNTGLVRNFPLALPPLAEQLRIVAKVDDLMALCDRLEASLANGDDTRRHLLDAILAGALADLSTPAAR